ncbi:hypothetical protein [Streptomyces meridianus]|uniref:Extensin n=1 Tax=Streptomyces meridianus TaxID=2938945 RepID=A0ABT0X664_9ACTN|nr:hypothetical protein [Streptomyces meridianus]MCM2577919.1 hypothetical protein [Streptomyces meridianus]
MADNRYSWLDATAAEHLLRGETADALAAVGTADARAREQAVELAATMEAMAELPAVVLAPDGELAGEAEAMRAFRSSRSGQAGARRRSHRAGGGSWPGRPLWAGLGVAFSAALLGGAAIASGALPKPFGEAPAPLPATSVSAVGTPSGTGQVPAASEQPPHGKRHGRSGEHPGHDGSSRRGGAGPSGKSGEQGDGKGAEPQPTASGDSGTVDADVCRKYRDGTLSEEQKRRVEEAAGGPEALDRKCDALLGVAGRRTDDGVGGPENGVSKGTENTTDPAPTIGSAPGPTTAPTSAPTGGTDLSSSVDTLELGSDPLALGS